MAAQPHATPPGPPPEPQMIPGVKHIIAVGAGKGGVGKSTVSVNLAMALQARGHKVGLMDGDVYGPSIPKMLGTDERPTGTAPGEISPNEAYGLKVMSMGFLLDPAKPMVVRGPIVHTIVRQFLSDVQWGELDRLIVDMPPGTGDVALSLGQSVAVTGAVVVSTPQDVSLLDVHKAVSMFRTLKIPVLGMVENMSGYVCPKCENHDDIFGTGGAEKWGEANGVDFMGRVPLHASVTVGGDQGRPALADDRTPAPVRDAFLGLGEALEQQLQKLNQEGPAGPLIQIRGLD